jgi:diguanylate cyclase (GGDEF)-like protein/PAS domain S-box-containing protein/putative nucleotidyltransferase with HDIG domain
MISNNPAGAAEIMVLADAQEDLSLLSAMLSSHGYKVRPVNSAELALSSFKSRKPDLILMDAGYSDMSVDDLCRKIRESGPATDIPMIFITQMDDAGRAAGHQVEGADFITRPCREEDLLRKVQMQLESHLKQKEYEDLHQSLYAAQETLRTMLKLVSGSIICTDEDGRITMMNDAARNMTGWLYDSAIGKHFREVFCTKNEQAQETAGDTPQKAGINAAAGPLSQAVLISRDGAERLITHCAAPIPGPAGKPAGFVLTFRDAANERLQSDEMEFISFHDQLTGLYNRRFLEAELSRREGSENLPTTLVMGDLNGLKMTNDAFGHLAGDDLLCKTAAILKKCFRREDIISRCGEDEFTVLLPNTTSREAEDLIKKVLEEVRGSKPEKGILSLSFGWDTRTDKGQSIFQVLKNAEDDMLRRKLLESPSSRSFTVTAIIKTLYEKNAREEAHSKRVSELGSAIGRAMGLMESEINKIKTAGLLHDIGKMAISNEVLEKNGPLNAAEWEEIKRHPEAGYRILCCTAEMADLAETVRQHHERWDGKGYPRGLRGGEITLEARIICVADSFDAMTSERPYRSGMPVREAREELRRHMGSQFDPDIVRVFLESGLV